MPKFVPLNYQPDLDCSWEYSPGAVTDMQNFVPRRRGTYASWSAHISNSKIADYSRTEYPVIAGIVRLPTGNVRCFAFEKQAIYELTDTTTATDRSKGGGYSASTTTWTWTMFGSACIATNLADTPQYSTSGAFADLAGSPPKAQFVVSQLGFIMFLNFDDGTSTPDGWYCSQLENPTGSWTPDNATQCAKGRLYDTPGPITAACALRDSVVAFKADSIYVGDYIGDTTNGIIWGWRLISDKVGCSAPHGVALLNDRLYFIHRSNVYEFDGSSVRPIGMPVVNYVVSELMGAGSVIGYVQAMVDQREGLVFWCFPSGVPTSVIDYALVYNVFTGRFGFVTALSTAASGTHTTDFYASCVVKTTQSDLIKWLNTTTTDPGTALLMGKSSGTKTAVWEGKYPGEKDDYNGGSRATAQVITGPIGNGEDGLWIKRVVPRLYTYVASDQNTTAACNVKGDKLEANVLSGVATHITNFVWSTTELAWDGTHQDRYNGLTFSFRGPVEVAGVYLQMKPSARN